MALSSETPQACMGELAGYLIRTIFHLALFLFRYNLSYKSVLFADSSFVLAAVCLTGSHTESSAYHRLPIATVNFHKPIA